MRISDIASIKLYLIFMDCYNFKQKSLPYLKIPLVMLSEFKFRCSSITCLSTEVLLTVNNCLQTYF